MVFRALFSVGELFGRSFGRRTFASPHRSNSKSSSKVIAANQSITRVVGQFGRYFGAQRNDIHQASFRAERVNEGDDYDEDVDSEMSESEDDGAEGPPTTKTDDAAKTGRRKREIDYFYDIAVLDNPLPIDNSSLVEVERIVAPIIRNFDRPVTTESWKKLLRITLLPESTETLFRILPILIAKLPNRWRNRSLDNWDRLQAFSSTLHDTVATILSSDDERILSKMTPDQLMTILIGFTNFFVPPSSGSIRPPPFVSRLLAAIGRMCSSLSNEQFVHFLFAVGLYRIMPTDDGRGGGMSLRLETELIKRHALLTIDQLYVGAFAFYRTDTTFYGGRLLHLIIQRAVGSSSEKPVESCGSNKFFYGDVMVMKLLKMNGTYEHATAISHLARRLINNNSNKSDPNKNNTIGTTDYSPQYLSHFASACRHMRYYDERVSEALIRRMRAQLDDMRLKDVTLMLSYLAAIAHPLPADLVDMVIDRLRCPVRDDYSAPPNLTTRILFSLALSDVYPLDLIGNVLRRDYIINFDARRTNKAKLPARALYWLDCSVAIERPEYSASRRLDLSLFKTPSVAPLLSDTVPIQCDVSSPTIATQVSQLSIISRMLRAAIGGSAGEECVFRGLILPHSPSPGVLVKFVTGKPIRAHVDQSLRSLDLRHVKVPKGEEWIAVLLQTPGSCRYRSTHYLGHHLAHQRQLAKLGYKVVRVHNKSLGTKPMDAGIKRFQQCLRLIRENPDTSIFIY